MWSVRLSWLGMRSMAKSLVVAVTALSRRYSAMFELFDFEVIVTRSACLARPASRSRECCRRAAVLKMKPYVTYFSTSHIKVVLRIDVWGYQAPVVVAKFLTFSMSDDFLTH